MQRCARFGLSPLALTGGVYTHRHPDHTGDLVPLLFAFRVAGRTASYPIHAGQGFAEFLEQLRGVYGKWIQAPVSVHEHPLDGPSSQDLGALTLHTRPANHSAGALHLGFEADGHMLVFSGDTAPSDELVELARGADLLVVECAGSDRSPVPGHMHPSAIAELVQAAMPSEVWLTHLYPHVDAREAVQTIAKCGVPVRHASEGDTWRS